MPFDSADAAAGITPFTSVEDQPDVPPGLAVFFYPERPTDGHQVFHFLEHVGWRIVDRPDDADWRVLYSLATRFRLLTTDRYRHQAESWLNGRCRDISKRRVQSDFANVFGYELAVDPTTYRGRCLRKSDANCVKDATVLACPIPASEILRGRVYQRLIDGTQPDGSLLEYRLHVVGGTLPIVRRKLHANWHGAGRLRETLLDVRTVPADDAFSAGEIAQILEFSRLSGLDLGALDVIRDVGDGRIYVLDVTKTPGTFYGTPAERDASAMAFCRAWLASYPPSRHSR